MRVFSHALINSRKEKYMGFIYIWRDKVRNMYYVGSHEGSPDDGYISSSHWLTGEVKYRPHDFKRRIIKMIEVSDMKTEEYRLLNMIKEDEFGKKYYNLKHGKPRGSVPWNKGKINIYSDETLSKMSAARVGKPTTKGKSNPQSIINGKKGASKLSSTVTGRRKKVLPDGSWTWEYPNK